MKKKFLTIALLAPLAFAPFTACSGNKSVEKEEVVAYCAHITGDISQATGWKNIIIEDINGCFILSEVLPNTGYFKIKGMEGQGWLTADTVEVVVNCEYCCGETLNKVFGGK